MKLFSEKKDDNSSKTLELAISPVFISVCTVSVIAIIAAVWGITTGNFEKVLTYIHFLKV